MKKNSSQQLPNSPPNLLAREKTSLARKDARTPGYAYLLAHRSNLKVEGHEKLKSRKRDPNANVLERKKHIKMVRII
jgi:hypothetical protein